MYQYTFFPDFGNFMFLHYKNIMDGSSPNSTISYPLSRENSRIDVGNHLNSTIIAQIPPGKQSGAKLFVSEAPGRKYKNVCRSLTEDLEYLKFCQVKVIVCLLEWSELNKLNLADYPNRAQGHNFIFYHFPIAIGKTGKFRENFAITSCIIKHLGQGDNVLVHCREGLCRAAVICACCLTHYKYNSDAAIHAIRQRRKGSIQNDIYENCVHNYYDNIKKKCRTM